MLSFGSFLPLAAALVACSSAPTGSSDPSPAAVPAGLDPDDQPVSRTFVHRNADGTYSSETKWLTVREVKMHLAQRGSSVASRTSPASSAQPSPGAFTTESVHVDGTDWYSCGDDMWMWDQPDGYNNPTANMICLSADAAGDYAYLWQLPRNFYARVGWTWVLYRGNWSGMVRSYWPPSYGTGHFENFPNNCRDWPPNGPDSQYTPAVDSCESGADQIWFE
jgi:hypothetical protein